MPLLSLASFMYKYKSLQTGQLRREHLYFLKNLLNFIIIKYLKQADNNLSFCVAECSPCGLSATGDIKTYECHERSKVNEVTNPNKEVPCELLSRTCFDCQKTSLSAIKDEIFLRDFKVMVSLAPEADTQWNPFNEV